jgi:butyrate kinase
MIKLSTKYIVEELEKYHKIYEDFRLKSRRMKESLKAVG